MKRHNRNIYLNNNNNRENDNILNSNGSNNLIFRPK